MDRITIGESVKAVVAAACALASFAALPPECLLSWEDERAKSRKHIKILNLGSEGGLNAAVGAIEDLVRDSHIDVYRQDCNPIYFNRYWDAGDEAEGPERNEDGTIIPNANFPDMKGLADYIHAKGFKAGLYSSPGPTTCGGCAGSYGYEAQDAKTYADWGYDFLKHDWCSYEQVAVGTGLERAMKPYRIMGNALREQNRDIVLSLSQYGKDDVSAWGVYKVHVLGHATHLVRFIPWNVERGTGKLTVRDIRETPAR